MVYSKKLIHLTPKQHRPSLADIFSVILQYYCELTRRYPPNLSKFFVSSNHIKKPICLQTPRLHFTTSCTAGCMNTTGCTTSWATSWVDYANEPSQPGCL